jgi:hypothetical protein
MTKRGPRPVFFVCAGVDPNKPGDVVSKSIQAASQTEAASLFFDMTKVKAKNIHGPFRPKRAQVMESTRSMKFTDQPSCNTIYDGCEVTVFFLKEPENHAYLVFTRRIDGQQKPLPKGTIIVPVSDLRINNE